MMQRRCQPSWRLRFYTIIFISLKLVYVRVRVWRFSFRRLLVSVVCPHPQFVDAIQACSTLGTVEMLRCTLHPDSLASFLLASRMFRMEEAQKPQSGCMGTNAHCGEHDTSAEEACLSCSPQGHALLLLDHDFKYKAGMKKVCMDVRER